jgi:hypothetical protein
MKSYRLLNYSNFSLICVSLIMLKELPKYKPLVFLSDKRNIHYSVSLLFNIKSALMQADQVTVR